MSYYAYANKKILFAVLAILLICSSNISSQTVGTALNIAPPANDNFANAINITSCCTNIAGTNIEATKEAGEPNHAGNTGGHSVWYKYTYSLSYLAGYTFTLRNSLSPFDTLLAVYTGSSVNALTLVASNDDFGSTPTNLTSTLFFRAVPGTTYYIAVDGFSGATGNFTLGIDINRTHAASNYYAGTGFSAASVFRPSNGNWYVTSTSGVQTVHWGQNGDIPAPADYDGDEVTDFAVFRPSDGNWHVLQSRTSTYRALHWGQSGDKPVPGDYLLANGYAQFAVFRPSNGTWYATNGVINGITQFGANGDKPAPRDFDADGKLDFTVFRPSNGTWYIQYSHDGTYRIQQWGSSEDIPVPGGYLPTGDADIAVWRPSNGNWYIYFTYNNQYAIDHFGQTGDIPQPIDYGTIGGITDLGIYRPSTGAWYIQERGLSSFYAFQFGLSGDIPTATAYPVQP
jgi:hypothetical protein